MSRFYYSNPNQCEGCGLITPEEAMRRYRSSGGKERYSSDRSVRFRPELGRTSCNDCCSPNGYAASQGMQLDPDPLRILAALD